MGLFITIIVYKWLYKWVTWGYNHDYKSVIINLT